jgi:DNA mismatch repair ATPase MutS
MLNNCIVFTGNWLNAVSALFPMYRWLRQPLLDDIEICKRQEVVQAFFQSTFHRNELRDGALKAVPDLDAVINK